MTQIATQTGLVGFLCEVTDQPISFQECLACARKGAPGCSMVPAVIHTATNSIRDPRYAQKLAEQTGAEIGFSVTELLSCARQMRLKTELPYYEKPSSRARYSTKTFFNERIVRHHLQRRYACRGNTAVL